MNSLFEMLTGNQSSQVSEQFAQQFNLQPDEAERAIESLMPAFSQGLKRNNTTPQDFTSFVQALASGGHSKFTDNPQDAFSSSGANEGNAILGHLFGSKDVSRSVAKRASQQSGVSTSILKKMLPALAPIVLGSITKQLTQQQAPVQHALGGGNGGLLGQILGELMKNAGGQGRRSPGGSNPLEEILKQMTGGSRKSGRGSGDSGALGDIFQDMLKQSTDDKNPSHDPDDMFGDLFGEESKTEPEFTDPSMENENTASRKKPSGGNFDDLFGDLFKPSKNSNKDYDEDIEDIFDDFMGPKT